MCCGVLSLFLKIFLAAFGVWFHGFLARLPSCGTHCNYMREYNIMFLGFKAKIHQWHKWVNLNLCWCPINYKPQHFSISDLILKAQTNNLTRNKAFLLGLRGPTLKFFITKVGQTSLFLTFGELRNRQAHPTVVMKSFNMGHLTPKKNALLGSKFVLTWVIFYMLLISNFGPSRPRLIDYKKGHV